MLAEIFYEHHNQMKLPRLTLKTQAKALLKDIEEGVKAEMEEAKKIPVSVLLWGPSQDNNSKISKLRLSLRTDLTKDGHLAKFSEELIHGNKMTIRLQQLIHAQKFDLIISLPYSPGSIAEIHDFVLDKRINKKLLVFLNEEYDYGYSNQSLNAVCSVLTFRAEAYNGFKEIPKIKRIVYDTVQTIREIKYLNQGKLI
ncbi:MAG: hypothetical protein ABL876_07010 [Chitinophagaceae bacterium]